MGQEALLVGRTDAVGALVVRLLEHVAVVGHVLEVEGQFVGEPPAVDLVAEI
jgi:hypothetical protein